MVNTVVVHRGLEEVGVSFEPGCCLVSDILRHGGMYNTPFGNIQRRGQHDDLAVDVLEEEV